MLLLRRTKLRLARRADLKRKISLMKLVAENIARAVVKVANDSVSGSDPKSF
jgi:hypothetical protein